MGRGAEDGRGCPGARCGSRGAHLRIHRQPPGRGAVPVGGRVGRVGGARPPRRSGLLGLCAGPALRGGSHGARARVRVGPSRDHRRPAPHAPRRRDSAGRPRVHLARPGPAVQGHAPARCPHGPAPLHGAARRRRGGPRGARPRAAVGDPRRHHVRHERDLWGSGVRRRAARRRTCRPGRRRTHLARRAHDVLRLPARPRGHGTGAGRTDVPHVRPWCLGRGPARRARQARRRRHLRWGQRRHRAAPADRRPGSRGRARGRARCAGSALGCQDRRRDHIRPLSRRDPRTPRRTRRSCRPAA